MHTKEIRSFLKDAWSFEPEKKSTIVTALEDFIRIENVSPAFDPKWKENGKMYEAADHLAASIETLKKKWATNCTTDDVGIKILGRNGEVVDPDGNILTPLLLVDIPAFGAGVNAKGTVMLYGHMDKQPGLDGKWSQGLGPYTPVINAEGRLYGRGGADDGYAVFSAFSAIMALRSQNIAHARCTILIEACEESGSIGLEYYLNLDEIKKQLGDVTLIVCLDSGCENYEQLWLTTSLRGLANGILDVKTIKEGVHSGDASGIVPSSFRILNQLIARVENPETGEIFPPELQVIIKQEIREQAARTAEKLGDEIIKKYNFLDDPDVQPVTDDLTELVLNRTWRAQLSVVGMEGLPAPADAGNVMLPQTTAKLSFRLPPTLNSADAGKFIEATLTRKPLPYNAHISFTLDSTGNGWAAPELAPWLKETLEEASKNFFENNGFLAMGEGGSIPFMGLLGETFPKAQFIITGVLGPHSNAHGPDEFLDIPTARKVSMCVAQCLAEHCNVERSIKNAAGKLSKNNWGSHRCCGHSQKHGSGRCSI